MKRWLYHHRQMPQVGTKFGRWLDLTFMQLQLDARQEPDGKA